jgi:hypothetical protein
MIPQRKQGFQFPNARLLGFAVSVRDIQQNGCCDKQQKKANIGMDDEVCENLRGVLDHGNHPSVYSRIGIFAPLLREDSSNRSKILDRVPDRSDENR